MTSGAKISAAQLMTFSVYGVEDAFWTVRLQSGFSVDGTRFGYSTANSRITTAATVHAVHVNAQPSPPLLNTSMTAVSWETTAKPRISQVQSLPWASWVHTPNAATAAVTGTASLAANRVASSRTAPSVFSRANNAPWNAKRPAVANPPSSVYGLNTSVKER